MNRDILSCSNVANRDVFFFVRNSPNLTIFGGGGAAVIHSSSTISSHMTSRSDSYIAFTTELFSHVTEQ